MTYMGKEYEKELTICIHRTDSPCDTPETNTIIVDYFQNIRELLPWTRSCMLCKNTLPIFFFRLTWLPYLKKLKHACEPHEIYSNNTPSEHLLLYQIVSPLWELVREISLWPQDQRWGGFVHVFVSNFQLFLDIKSYYPFKLEFVSCLLMWGPWKWNKC